MSADDSDAKKKFGFGKPPTHSQWKPGQSGNSRGRPKGALNFTTEVKLMLEAPIVVNDKGKPKKVTTLKAGLLRLREMALKGNPRCLAIFLDHAARYGGISTEPASEMSSEDDEAILDAYREEVLAEQTKENPGSRNDEDEDPK